MSPLMQLTPPERRTISFAAIIHHSAENVIGYHRYYL
jgi:hypothetical protein